MNKDSGVSSKINNPEVAAVFRTYPEVIRERLMFLRHLILETAAATEGVGELEETLKWGEAELPDCENKERKYRQNRLQKHRRRRVCHSLYVHDKSR